MNNAQAAARTEPGRPSPSGSHELRVATEIDALLRRLCRFNSLISIRRAGDLRAHATSILLVQNMLRRIVIDALPDELSSPGAALQLRTRFDGAELMFCSTVIGRLLHDGSTALAIAVPPTIRLHERRIVHRLPILP